MDHVDPAVAANVVAAVLAEHFRDLGSRSDEWSLSADALYLAALTRRALGPLLSAQHALARGAELLLETSDDTELRAALAGIKRLAYTPDVKAGEIVRLTVSDDGRGLTCRWSSTADRDVQAAVLEVALHLVDGELVGPDTAADKVWFTARRWGGAVEVDHDVQLVDSSAGWPLTELQALAIAACDPPST